MRKREWSRTRYFAVASSVLKNSPARRKSGNARRSGWSPSMPRLFHARPWYPSHGMGRQFLDHLKTQLAELETAGLYKHERVIDSPQSAEIHVAGGGTVLNFCANNYLRLANHPDILAAAHEPIAPPCYGMASVRFICGNHDLHRELRQRIAPLPRTEDSIPYGP